MTFGANGRIQLSDGPSVLAIDSAGRIYVPGASGTLVRIGADGVLDAGYPGAAADVNVTITSIGLDSAERPVLFGSVGTGASGKAYVTRLDSAGTPDATFNTTGHAEIALGNGLASGTEPCVGALQSGDRPVIACSVTASPGGTDVAFARLTAGGVLDNTFGVGQQDSDTYPDPFTFPDVIAPYGSARVLSATIAITGFNGRTDIFGGSADLETAFSIGCDGTFTRSGPIEPGQTVCIRQPASLQPGGTVTTTLNIGGRTGTFTVISSNSPADTVPDLFAFVDVTNSALGVAVVSDPVKILGITGFAAVSVENGEYSLECSPAGFRTTPNSQVVNGMNICVRHTTSPMPGTGTSTTLTVGGVRDTFTSTTVPADTTPDVFAFTDQTGVTPSSTVVSNQVTISGLNFAAPVSISGGELSIGCNATFASGAATIQNGQSICVRHVASAQPGTTVSTTLTIGGVSDTFSSTTAPASEGGGAETSRGSGGGALDRFTIAALLALFALSRRLARRRPHQNRLLTDSVRLSTV